MRRIPGYATNLAIDLSTEGILKGCPSRDAHAPFTYLMRDQVDERQPVWNPFSKPARGVILDSVIRLKDYHDTD